MKKNIVYYTALLLFLILVVISLVIGNQNANAMSMTQMISISIILAIYVVGMSFVGESTPSDERFIWHKYLSNRAGLIAGTSILSLGIIVQIFNHTIDYWLLAGLAAINVTKIITLIWANYKK